jgi:hypothetical protein
MNYEEVEIATGNPDQSIGKHIVIYIAEGTTKSFPVDANNPEYVSFLESLEDDTEASE